jgi:membrane protein insertase Oxa1/YidC/SpoIIIJ
MKRFHSFFFSFIFVSFRFASILYMVYSSLITLVQSKMRNQRQIGFNGVIVIECNK